MSVRIELLTLFDTDFVLKTTKSLQRKINVSVRTTALEGGIT